MLSVTGLGEYTPSQFVCGPRGGVYSCRPRDFPQLEVFKDLQMQANNLVHAIGLSKQSAIIMGLQSCSGGFVLAIDGRIGPCTVRTVSELVLNKTAKYVEPPAALERDVFQKTPAYIATYAPEILEYLTKVAGIANAPKDVPAPPTQPISKTTAPGAVPIEPQVDPSQDILRLKRKKKIGLVVGVLAGLAAVGLVGTGVYYYRQSV